MDCLVKSLLALVEMLLEVLCDIKSLSGLLGECQNIIECRTVFPLKLLQGCKPVLHPVDSILRVFHG